VRREQVDRVRENLEQAKVAVADARRRPEARLVEAAESGETITPDTTLREARAAEFEAQDQFDVATAALALSKSRGRSGTFDRRARARLDKYVGGAMRTKAGPLLEKAQAPPAALASRGDGTFRSIRSSKASVDSIHRDLSLGGASFS
jgi:hypothetical protein